MKMKWTARAAGIVLLGGAVALAAVTITVNSARIYVREEPDQYSKLVIEARRGAALEGLETQGGYQKVKFEGKIGWVRTADLEPRKYSAPADTGRQIAQGSTAGSASEAASGKGLGDGVNAYAGNFGSEANVNPAALEALMDQRTQIVNSGGYSVFARQGNVGKR